MKSVLKKVLSFLLAAIVLFGSAPRIGIVYRDHGLFSTEAKAKAYNGQGGDNLTWSFDNSTGELAIDGTGDMWDWEWDVHAPWYPYCSEIKSVAISDGVTSIGEYAFENCSFKVLDIPDSVTTIGYAAFIYCGIIEEIIIGNGVTDFNLKYPHEAYVTFCPDKIQKITVKEDNPSYSSDERGVLFNKDKTELIQYPKGNTSTSYVIPESVKVITDYAFRSCYNLEDVVIGSNVETIGKANFEWYSFESITIPDSVKYIGDNAFALCHNLKGIDIPDSVKTIGNNAFFCCDAMTSVTIGSGLEHLGYSAFDCSSLINITVDPDNKYFSVDDIGVLFNKDKTELIQYPVGNTATAYRIPNGVKTIRDCAFFWANNLKGISIPDSVTDIGYASFHGCSNLETVRFGKNLKAIGDNAFTFCEKLSAITLPDSLTAIGNNAFEGCEKIRTLEIPDSVTTIGFNAFASCSNLRSVVIGSGVTYMDYGIFANSQHLNVHYLGTKESWNNIFYDDPYCSSGFAFIHFVDTDWVTSVEPTDTTEGKKVLTCPTCGSVVSVRSIPTLSIATDTSTDVSLLFNEKDYDGTVGVDVKEVSDGAAFNIVYNKTGTTDTRVYDIAMTIDGAAAQPDGKIKVRIPLPADFDARYTSVYYVDTINNTVGKIPAKYSNGYFVFETDHFSYYAIVCKPVRVHSVTIDDVSVDYKSSAVISADIRVDADVDYTVSFSSTDPSIASVDRNGSVSTGKTGSATITCTVTDEYGNTVTDTCEITVKYNWWQWIIVIVLFGWIWY